MGYKQIAPTELTQRQRRDMFMRATFEMPKSQRGGMCFGVLETIRAMADRFRAAPAELDSFLACTGYKQIAPHVAS
jgi:hypothetical protein